jgi:hypothetical protein
MFFAIPINSLVGITKLLKNISEENVAIAITRGNFLLLTKIMPILVPKA